MVCDVTDAGTVRIILVDHDRGSELASTDLPGAQLPASLEPGMTLYVEDQIWEITRAEPSGVAAAIAAGKVTVWARRIELVTSPSTQWLFSVPTICEELAPTDPNASTTDLWLLSEDDWRQIEWIHRSLIDIVTAEIRQVRGVRHDHTHPSGGVIGYSAIHGRRQPVAPLAGLVKPSTWRSLLPAPSHIFQGLGYHDGSGAVAGGFASSFDRFVVYGVTKDDNLNVLGLDIDVRSPTPIAADGFGESVAHAMSTLDLILVDWCRAEIIEPDQVGQQLARYEGASG
jgi:hypothetical protein